MTCELNQYIFNFFILFSRFEYTLKKLKFTNINRRAHYPDLYTFSLNWSDFSTKYNEQFSSLYQSDACLRHSVDYMVENPPYIQLKNKTTGDLEWKEQHSNKELKNLIYLITSIRNNLFHGGKSSENGFINNTRDVELIKNSIVILKALINLDTEVTEIFNEGFDFLMI